MPVFAEKVTKKTNSKSKVLSHGSNGLGVANILGMSSLSCHVFVA